MMIYNFHLKGKKSKCILVGRGSQERQSICYFLPHNHFFLWDSLLSYSHYPIPQCIAKSSNAIASILRKYECLDYLKAFFTFELNFCLLIYIELLILFCCWWFPYFVTIIPWLTGLLGWSNKLVSPELIPKLIEKIKSRSFFTSWCLCYSTFLYIFFSFSFLWKRNCLSKLNYGIHVFFYKNRLWILIQTSQLILCWILCFTR